MTRLELDIRLTRDAHGGARAWYIPGGAADLWLREIAPWRTPHDALTLLPVPRSPRDATARGVLVVPASGDVRGVSARCQGYRLVGGRLYLPVAARLSPAVDEQELRALLDPQYDYVWHPGTGLIAVAAEDRLSVSMLVALGDPRPEMWTAARPGIAAANRLISLAADQQLTVEQLLRQGREDIGGQSGSLEDLPPSDREPEQGAWNAISRQGTRAAANVVQWLAGGAAGATGGAAWLENWRQWASQRLQQISAEMEAARNREITRLMDLLEKDPDLGLQFALPLTGDAHRGAAPPGSRLGRHGVDFNLANFGGGRPSDCWSLLPGYYELLRHRYFELARREQRLGRCRRAAYIFAELLGDFQSAAAALIAGAHWREAAALYKQRLGQPLEAARCLERGGLSSEAIEIYVEQQQFEKAGDLHTALQQHDEARQAYEAALLQLRNEGDVLGAARLLEEKLDAPQDALAEVARGWPYSGQASACLRRVFELAGRLGAHEEALRWVNRLRDDPPSRPYTYFDTVETLSDVAGDYPDAQLRRRAADASRVLISRKLPAASASETGKLMASLMKLAPGDRLLSRDCQRYTDSLRIARTPRICPSTSSRREARKIATLRFDSGIRWKQFVTCGSMVYAAGRIGRRIVVARCGWDAEYVESATARWRSRSGADAVLLCMAPHRDPHLLVHSLTDPPLSPLPGFPREQGAADAARAGGGPGVTEATLGASRATADRTWVVKALEDSLYLYCLSNQGENLAGVCLSPHIEDAPSPHEPIPLHAAALSVYVALGTRLVMVDQQQKTHVLELPRPIEHLTGTSPHTLLRVAATFEVGAVLCWEGFEQVRIAHDVVGRPVAGFNRRGLLTVVSRHGGEVYRTGNRQAEVTATIPPPKEQPIAVLPPPHVKQTALAFASGKVDIYEVP